VGRIVLFGATGYTGRLVASALVGRGARPVLAARSADRVRRLAEELGGLESATADVSQPGSIRALVERGDVLLSTVGPFLRYGAPAVEAAIDAGAHYLDSTGEPPFIRRVFEEWGPRAQGSGCALLTAMGYDFVPGNLAGALALERAGDGAVGVRVGYFFTGSGSIRGAGSGGTMASMAGVMFEPHFAWRGGRLVTEPPARRVHGFPSGGRTLTGISIGGSEHFALPHVRPGLRDVDVYLGWFGPASRAMQAIAPAGGALMRIGPVKRGAQALTQRFVPGSTGGPGPEERAKTGSLIVGEALGPGGDVLARVELRGPNGYTYTGDILAWAAERLASEPGPTGTGALGPVEAFGLRELEAGNAEAGLTASA